VNLRKVKRLGNNHSLHSTQDSVHARLPVVLASDPVRVICPVLRFKSPGNVSQLLVLMLPGPGESLITHQDSFQFTTAVFPFDSEMLEVKDAFAMLWHNWVKHTDSLVSSASGTERFSRQD